MCLFQYICGSLCHSLFHCACLDLHSCLSLVNWSIMQAEGWWPEPPTYTPTVTSLTRLHLGLHLHCRNEIMIPFLDNAESFVQIHFVSLSNITFLRNSKNLTTQAQEEITHEKYPKVTNSREIDQIDHRK